MLLKELDDMTSFTQICLRNTFYKVCIIFNSEKDFSTPSEANDN